MDVTGLAGRAVFWGWNIQVFQSRNDEGARLGRCGTSSLKLLQRVVHDGDPHWTIFLLQRAKIKTQRFVRDGEAFFGKN